MNFLFSCFYQIIHLPHHLVNFGVELLSVCHCRLSPFLTPNTPLFESKFSPILWRAFELHFHIPVDFAFSGCCYWFGFRIFNLKITAFSFLQTLCGHLFLGFLLWVLGTFFIYFTDKQLNITQAGTASFFPVINSLLFFFPSVCVLSFFLSFFFLMGFILKVELIWTMLGRRKMEYLASIFVLVLSLGLFFVNCEAVQRNEGKFLHLKTFYYIS